MPRRLTFAVGDIHGCIDELRSLLDSCRKTAADAEYDLVLLGDYVDRGPASREVVDYIMREQSKGQLRLRCLRGNHDSMLSLAADCSRTDADLVQWWANGGEATLDSYGVGDPSDLPADHLQWLRSLPFFLHENGRFFVHAGVRPGVSLHTQSEHDMLWIREPFLSSELWHGALIVHGHTPTVHGAPDARANRVNLDTGACFGGPLTAAAFSPDKLSPLFYLNSDGLRFRLPVAGA
jgi:serine/threonine protein phosphatase 1